MSNGGLVVPFVFEVAFALLALALSGAIFRILRGPTLPDRVLGLDLMSILLLCFGSVFSIVTGESAFLDVAITLALIGFLGTVALARYLERRWERDMEAAAKSTEATLAPGGRP